MKLSSSYYKLPIIEIDKNNQNMESQIQNALDRIKAFVDANHLSTGGVKQLVTNAIIYDTYDLFLKHVIPLLDLPKDVIAQASISGTIINRVLYIVSPRLYTDIYPIEGQTETGYEKLITHELAHQLHIDILNGDEDKMGPRWFYEGFAIYVAHQFVDKKALDKKQMIKIIENELYVSYDQYAGLFEEVLKIYDFKEIVKRADTESFKNELIKKISQNI
ncbi:MAG: hypothetical protein K8Q99_03555 [Acholeplasmataceae bacterium]|nr:hypothetical protein [Acholeplasmataceae bacterium]